MAVPQVRFRYLGVVLKLLDRFGGNWTRRFEPPDTAREQNEPDGQCNPPTINVAHTIAILASTRAATAAWSRITRAGIKSTEPPTSNPSPTASSNLFRYFRAREVPFLADQKTELVRGVREEVRN
jgi:hypothetical protein